MSVRIVILLDDAVLDLELAIQFYDAQESGLGSYFLRSILKDIELLKDQSGTHGQHFGCYRVLSKRFPFANYYEIDTYKAYVLAVLDMRQNPLGIRGKLKGRHNQD